VRVGKDRRQDEIMILRPQPYIADRKSSSSRVKIYVFAFRIIIALFTKFSSDNSIVELLEKEEKNKRVVSLVFSIFFPPLYIISVPCYCRSIR